MSPENKSGRLMSKPNLFNRRSNSNNSSLRTNERSEFRYYSDGSDDLLGIYLKDVARVPLLTKEQEVELAKRIELGKKASQELAFGDNPLADVESLRKTVEDGTAAIDHLIVANLRLVISVAKKYQGRGIPFPDLIDEGNIGLIRSAEKFDYRKGHKFSTYATWWIRQAVTRHIADQARVVSLPIYLGGEINHMYIAINKLTQTLQRKPTDQELADALDITPYKIAELKYYAQKSISLETPVGDEDDSVLGDFIENERTPDPVAEVSQQMLSSQLSESMNESLTPREKRVLDLRYGLEDGISYTLEKIGQKLGVTKKRARQLERKALRHLRNPYNTRQLRDYLR